MSSYCVKQYVAAVALPCLCYKEWTHLWVPEVVSGRLPQFRWQSRWIEKAAGFHVVVEIWARLGAHQPGYVYFLFLIDADTRLPVRFMVGCWFQDASSLQPSSMFWMGVEMVGVMGVGVGADAGVLWVTGMYQAPKHSNQHLLRILTAFCETAWDILADLMQQTDISICILFYTHDLGIAQIVYPHRNGRQYLTSRSRGPPWCTR